MNKYKVMYGGKYANSNDRLDGQATIEGETFEQARLDFVRKQKEEGFLVGFCEQYTFEITEK